MSNEQLLREVLRALLAAIQEPIPTDEVEVEQQNDRIRRAVLVAETALAQPAEGGEVVGLVDAVEAAITALDTAKNGLLWYQDEHPEDASEADNETLQDIDEARCKLNALLLARSPASQEQAQRSIEAHLRDCASCANQTLPAYSNTCRSCNRRADGSRVNWKAQQPKPQPMTEDQVWHSDAIMSANSIAGFKMSALMRVVRAVEDYRDSQWLAHHGITSTKEAT